MCTSAALALELFALDSALKYKDLQGKVSAFVPPPVSGPKYTPAQLEAAKRRKAEAAAVVSAAVATGVGASYRGADSDYGVDDATVGVGADILPGMRAVV